MRPSPEIMKFMETYGVDSDEVWQVHGSNYVVKHKALERVAVERGIKWDRPAMLECNSEKGVAALVVFGTLGDRMEWSIGEALVAREGVIGGNYKVTGKQAGYVYAMAEKRAKDRVILKLLNAHGALYSEAEADEFEQRQNPHVTRPTDVFDPIERDRNGQPIDNIPHVEPGKKLTVAEQRPIFAELQKEAHATTTRIQLRAWMNNSKTLERIGSLKSDWQEFMRGLCAEHMAALKLQEAGDDQRSNILMAG